jgi:MinD-like ATPase involved in chromosome partitioning or flagellar assembly
MRGSKGRLICIWSPVLHGEGCSTLACALGFGMHYLSGKKVLIVNKSNSTSHMEKYVGKDIEIKYSMDNLKIFNAGIRTEHILTYATQVNTGLYMIAGSRFKREITRENNDFDRLFIDRCLEGFDMVITDMDTGVREENKLYLDRADNIIAVFTPNEIIMDELYQHQGLREVLDYFTDEKTVSVINKLYEGWETSKVIGKYISKYSLSKTFGLNYDGDVLNSCCTDNDFYSFLMKEIKREKNEYVKQLADICDFLIDALYMEKNTANSIKNRGIFKRLLRSSLF